MYENDIHSSEENTTEHTSAFEMPSNNETSVIYNDYSSQKTTPANESEPTETLSMGFAITSLVLGILSILSSCCCVGLVFGIPGIVFGCLQEKNAYDKKPKMAVAGIITSIIGVALCVVLIILRLVLSSVPLLTLPNMF